MSVLGIEIGASHVRSGRVDRDGRVAGGRAIRTPATLEALETALHYIVASGEPPPGIGIVCKGVVDPATTRVVAMNGSAPQYLEGCRLAELVRPALRAAAPIYADAEARAALAAEAMWGAAKRYANALMFVLDGGVQGAAMAGGRLLRGESGAAGGFGHITVEPDGEPCACGNRGCLETVFSERAIETAAFGVVRRGCPSLLTEVFQAQPLEITCRAVFEAAANGDAPARAIAARAVGAMARVTASLARALDPAIVILGGGMAGAGEALFGPLRVEVRRLAGREISIAPQGVENRGVAGAAALAVFGAERADRAEPADRVRASG